jgi:CheY-like chemotaxis protein
MTGPSGSPETPPRHVLVVEDDFDIREAMTMVLEDEGYVVGSAANGREALDLLATTPRPDVIVLDLMMPIMNGWEFLKALRADPSYEALNVVVVSAVPDGSAFAPVQGVVPKPIDMDRLLATVRRWSVPRARA